VVSSVSRQVSGAGHVILRLGSSVVGWSLVGTAR
jgi:hypothetical protein